MKRVVVEGVHVQLNLISTVLGFLYESENIFSSISCHIGCCCQTFQLLVFPASSCFIRREAKGCRFVFFHMTHGNAPEDTMLRTLHWYSSIIQLYSWRTRFIFVVQEHLQVWLASFEIDSISGERLFVELWNVSVLAGRCSVYAPVVISFASTFCFRYEFIDC